MENEKQKIREITKLVKKILRISHKEDDIILELHAEHAISHLENSCSKITERLFNKLKSILITHVVALYNEELTSEKLEFINIFYRSHCNYKMY
ncbi:MAG: hypothetical protein RLN62_05780 [Rickettsiales bacterium]